MFSRNDETGDNISYALTVYEKKVLSETKIFTKKCGNKIAEDQKNFADKSYLGLWWDAKGIFKCSDVADVTAHMESYKKFYEEIDTLSVQVERGDPKSYERLLDIYKKLEQMTNNAQRDVKNNQSSAVCKMLKEFLDKKYHLDHGLKKVGCIVLKQKNQAFEQTKNAVNEMSKCMDKLIEENSGMKEDIKTLKKENEESTSEAEKRIGDIRRESDEKVDKLIEENRSIKYIIEIMRKEKEEAEKRSVAIHRESDEKLKQVVKEAEERSEAHIRKMKEECDKLRLEAEIMRRESDEKLKQAVEEANRQSEARMQEMAEQNTASLQNMMKMLESMYSR